MSDYREECIKHKLVQKGIIEQRSVTVNKPKAKCDWLIIYFDGRNNRWNTLNKNGYRTEEDARKALRSIYFYHPFVIERHVFEEYYKSYRS
jgi:hypothetical protein